MSCATAGATTAPTAADDVTICSGVTVTMNGNPGAALSLTINGIATWTQARTTNVGAGGIVINGDITGAANGVLTVTGGLTLNGVTLTSNTVTVTRQTTAAQTISGTGSLARLAINATTTNNATLTVRTALTGTSTLTNAAGQTLNIGGTSTITTLTATASPNTVNYTATAAQTVKATTYHHLTKSGAGGTATAGGILTVNGTLTVSSGTLALSTFNSQFNGPTNVTGTLSMTTGTKTFVGAVTVNAGGVWTSSAAGTSIFRGGITHNGTTFTAGVGQFNTNSQALAGSSAMTFAGTVTVTDATTVTNNNTNTVTITGNLNGSVAGSTFINGASATLDYRGANAPMATGVLTANASANTVIYGLGGAQAVRLPSAGYYHLTLSNSNTKTAPAGTLAVLGNLTVNAGPTFTANTNDPTLNVTGNVTVAGTYQSSSTAAALTIGGNLSVSGTYTGNGGPANLAGDFTRTGTFTSGAGVFTFNGSALQTLTGATTFTSLTVNNSGAGLSLANDITATTAAAGTLVLTAGPVATGSNNLIVPRSCTTPSVTRTNGWVAGNLRLAFPTGAPTCTFHVGDASNYRPIGMTFASVTTAGSLTGTVSQSAGEHPNIATSGLDSAKDVNRYWTLTNPGGIAFTTYTATFNFINPGDFDVGANPTYFEIERWNGAWNTTTLGTAVATSTSASGLPSFGAGVSNSFAVGQKKPPTVVSINLASPDPATSGTSVDWTVTFSSSVTGVDSTDFTLVMGGGLSGASITGVAGGGTTWTVTADTGVGGGTLGLNLVDDDTIVNAASTPLGGVGAGNGNFTGQVYTVVATSSGFIFTDSACVHNIAIGAPGQTCALIGWSPQVAGQALAGVYITAVNTSGVPTRLHASAVRTRNMEFGLSCHNPIAHAGVQATFAGVTLPLCQGSGATPTTWSSTVTVTFPGGSPSSNTSYSFNYADVGLVELWMRNNATPAQTGSSGTFVVKPYGFTVTGIKRTSDSVANPAAADATGAAFIKAGASFTATVTATASGGAATPNYGKESAAEGVKLTAALVSGLGLSNLPTLTNDTIAGSEFGSGGMVSDANGVATVTNLAWNEVGIIRLTPSVADASYLGAGDVTGTTSVNVGRFYPDHFALTPGNLIDRAGINTGGSETCASIFTYMNEPFQVGFTLMAKGPSPGNATLLNYVSSATPANDFSKLATATPVPAGFGFAYLDGTTNLTGRVYGNLGITGSWTAGELAATATLAFKRDTAPDGPFSAMKVGVAPVDSDGVVLSAFDMDVTAPAGNDHAEVGQTQIRYGRLRLSNVFGTGSLQVPMLLQFWSGNSWVPNSADSCTVFPLASVGLTGAISPVKSCVASPINYCSGSDFKVVGGISYVKLTATATDSGSIYACEDLGADPSPGPGTVCSATSAGMSFLQGRWPPGTSYDNDPVARATFGVYSPETRKTIHIRELY